MRCGWGAVGAGWGWFAAVSHDTRKVTQLQHGVHSLFMGCSHTQTQQTLIFKPKRQPPDVFDATTHVYSGFSPQFFHFPFSLPLPPAHFLLRLFLAPARSR